jgi:DNA-binding FadR family transcriptional regulator
MPAPVPIPSPAPQRTFEDIAGRIRRRVACGELKAGDKLPAEREMAEQFGVGRNAVREALRSLEMAGVVRLEKGRAGGAFIRPVNASRVTRAIGDLLDHGSIGWAELTEARALVLDAVVRLACVRATAADLDALDRNVAQTEALTRAGRFEERFEVVHAFYGLLAATAGNRALGMLVTATSDLVRRFVEAAARTGDRVVVDVLPGRRRLMAALHAGDPEAASAELLAYMREVHETVDLHPVGVLPAGPAGANVGSAAGADTDR